jgi:hemolysin III
MSEYSVLEEKINVYTHLAGALVGLFGLCLLSAKALGEYDLKSRISFIIFGISLVALYFSSTNYHRTTNPELRLRRKIIDHCAIYVLIAGTYTPLALALIGGRLGWMIFSLSWGLATIGVTLKLFFTGRFKMFSTIMYVLMGWMILLFVNPLIQVMPEEGLLWLISGGLLYTTGALVYMIKKINFNHSIFHLFILAGSFCHFVSVYFYI